MANAPQLTVGLGFDLDEASARKVVKGMERLGEYLEKSSNESASKVVQTWRTKLNSLGNDFEKIGMRLSASLSLPFGLLGAKIIEATRDYDRLKQSLTSIEGTSEKMGKRLELLSEIAKAPGIGFEQAIQGDVRLRAVGISADMSAKALTQFANAIAFTGGTASQLDLVTYQLGQMSAKGKVLGNDLRPIIEQAPAVAGALKKMFNTTDSEQISKILQSMGKDSTDFIEMLVTKLEEIPRVKGGFNNAIENMGIAVKGFFANIGESLFSAVDLEGAFKGIESFLNNLAELIKNLSPEAKKFLLVIGGLVVIAPPILVALGLISTAIAAISAPLLVAVGVVTASAVIILNTWEGLSKTLTNSGFFKGFQSLFIGMFEIISQTMSMFSNLFSGNWAALGENIKNIFKGLNNAIIGIFQIIIGTVGKGMSQLFSMVGMDSVAKGISGGTSAFLEFAEKSKFALTGTTNKVKELGKSVSEFFKNNPNVPKDPKDPKGDKEFEKLTSWLKKSAEESERFEKSIKKINKELEELRKKEWKESPMGQAVSLDYGKKLQDDLKRQGESGKSAKSLKIFQKLDWGFEWTDSSLDDAGKSLKEKFESLKGRIQPTITNFGLVLSEDMTLALSYVTDAMNISFNFLGDTLSNAFASIFNKDIKFDFKKLLGQFLKGLGSMVMQMAVELKAVAALKTKIEFALASVGGGGFALAGAIGLFALGAAMVGGGMALSQSGNQSPSQSQQYNSTFTAPVQGSSNQSNKVEFVIQGTTLKGVLNNVNNSFG